MKIDFTKKLVSFNDKPLVMSPDSDEAVTLGWVATEALMQPPSQAGGQAASLSASEALERNELARRIFRAKGPIDVKPEEVTLIRRLVPVRFPAPVIAAPALEALDAE